MGPINGFVNINQNFSHIPNRVQARENRHVVQGGIFDKTKEMQIQREQTRNDKDI